MESLETNVAESEQMIDEGCDESAGLADAISSCDVVGCAGSGAPVNRDHLWKKENNFFNRRNDFDHLHCIRRVGSTRDW